MLRELVPAAVKHSIKHPAQSLRHLLSDRLVPPPWLHGVGDGDFEWIGQECVRQFRELGGLKPTDRVLDIGCGTGRMALPLTRFLTSGTYDGMDIVRDSINWCRKAYRGFPNFRFHYADIDNPSYSRGPVEASSYRFPFPDKSFDFIFLTSVFTHMLRNDVEHYLAEISRMTAGTVFVTVFLLDPPTRALIAQGQSKLSFRHPLEGCYAELLNRPEEAIAYERDDFLNMAANAGLTVVASYDGDWRGTSGTGYQDIVILR